MRAVSSSRLARDGGSTSTRAKPREWTATIRPWCRRGCRLHSTTVRQGTCRACGCRRFRFTRRRHRPAARRRTSYRATGRLRLPSNRSFSGGAACRRLGSDPGRPRMHTGVVRFRDHHAELARAGADVVGLSTQDTAYERDASTSRSLSSQMRNAFKKVLRALAADSNRAVRSRHGLRGHAGRPRRAVPRRPQSARRGRA
jgi:hypothetical protein